MRNLFLFLKLLLIDFLLWKERIKIKKVQTEEEKRQAIELIWKIYKQKGYIDLHFFPNPSSFRDEFDQNSVYFVAFLKNKIVGASRLIFSSPLGFLSEKFFNLNFSLTEKNKVAELSRLVVLDEKNKYRKTIVALGLLKKCFSYSKNKKIEYWYVVIGKKLKIYFEKFNIKFYELPFNPPLDRHLENIKPHLYFQTHKPKPYKVILREIEENLVL